MEKKPRKKLLRRERRPAKEPSSLPVIGWREWVELPGLAVPRMKAKVDTGARSSCLHAFGLQRFERDGRKMVRFEVHPLQRSDGNAQLVECEVHDERTVRSSNGKSELRPVIRTAVQLLGASWEIDVTLTSRDQMGFRMLLGREAVRGRYLIHTGRSYVGGRPLRKKQSGEESTQRTKSARRAAAADDAPPATDAPRPSAPETDA